MFAVEPIYTQAGFWVIVVAISIVSVPVYMLPTIIAYNRGHRNRTAIMLLNVFLGGFLVGWVAALVWATLEGEERGRYVRPGERTNPFG